MATAEQMQEALQQIQMLTARITTLETQLQFESARAQTAEQERSALIPTLVTTGQERAGGMVDTKGIGQPFMWKGSADQDFGEWSHKVRTFMLPRFGYDILTALTWGARQQKIVAKTCVASQRNRMISWNTVFGEQAGEDAIEPNRIVGNSGEGNGLEAWRRPHSEYDPTSSMRRVAILQQVQNPSRCGRVEDLGPALERWLSKKRQYEMFTDRNGRPCQASDDTLVAAMFRMMPKSLEEKCYVRPRERGLPGVVRQTAGYSGTKKSITMSENKTARKDDPMDVDALSKGKSKGKGKKEKGQNHMSNAVCWNCGKTGVTGGVAAVSGGGREAKAKVECKVTNMLMDGLGEDANNLMDGGKRTNGRVQDSGRLGTRRTNRWNP